MKTHLRMGKQEGSSWFPAFEQVTGWPSSVRAGPGWALLWHQPGQPCTARSAHGSAKISAATRPCHLDCPNAVSNHTARTSSRSGPDSTASAGASPETGSGHMAGTAWLKSAWLEQHHMAMAIWPWLTNNFVYSRTSTGGGPEARSDQARSGSCWSTLWLGLRGQHWQEWSSTVQLSQHYL